MKYLTKHCATVLEILQELRVGASNSNLRQILKRGHVTVDDQVVVKANHLLEIGQSVCIVTTPRDLPDGIEILYKDRSMIVINKPQGLLSIPLDLQDRFNALETLRNHFHLPQIYAVHRLDREASGVMVFACGKRSTKLFNKMFKNHALKRVYFAIVQGHLKNKSGTWESYLLESENYKVHVVANASEGKKAITHYQMIKRSKNFSFLELTLETGRKHQIRIQCKEAGHPIAGDRLYGLQSCNPISRMCLHSSFLELIHPFTNKKMQFMAPSPSSFSNLGWPAGM